MKKTLIINILIGIAAIIGITAWVGVDNQPTPAVMSTTAPSPTPALSELAQINAVRAAHKLPALTEDPRFDKAAQLKANDLVARNYFAHNIGTENVFAQLVPQFTSSTHWNFAENLAKCAADPTVRVTAWTNSPGHLTNMLGDYTLWGTGSAHNAKDNCDYTVNYFGKQLP